MCLNGKPIQFVLDCGAELNMIEEATYEAFESMTTLKCSELAKLYEASQLVGMGNAEISDFIASLHDSFSDVFKEILGFWMKIEAISHSSLIQHQFFAEPGLSCTMSSQLSRQSSSDWK